MGKVTSIKALSARELTSNKELLSDKGERSYQFSGGICKNPLCPPLIKERVKL
jgi:hypothetical protein